MRKHWVALLSMLGLAGGGMRMESQVLKGSKPSTATESKVKSAKTAGQAPAANNGKLQVKQQTLRQQNPSGVAAKSGQPQKAVGQNTGTCRYSEGCQTQNKQLTKGNQQITKGNQQITKGNNANKQLTPPPPGQAGARSNQQLTKGNQQLTKGNQQITKGNQAITKGNNQQITKGNQQITKGNQQITKGNQQITKGNTAVTKAAAPK
jgi:hypothetical protein